jgi:hypothetical protein
VEALRHVHSDGLEAVFVLRQLCMVHDGCWRSGQKERHSQADSTRKYLTGCLLPVTARASSPVVSRRLRTAATHSDSSPLAIFTAIRQAFSKAATSKASLVMC